MVIPSPLERLPEKLGKPFDVELWIKRDDLIHPVISGNKYRKLKYNLLEVNKNNFNHVLTFGGAHSNHIASTAYLCKQFDLKCTGIIRGEEAKQISPTLKASLEAGMDCQYVSRSEYRNKNTPTYLEALQTKYPSAYIIPEGGANELGIKGCEEIVTECKDLTDFDFITVDCGTGATLAGMVRQLQPHQKAIGVQVLKGQDFISNEVEDFSPNYSDKFEIWTAYHFGGYAKFQPELIQFMRWFYDQTSIKLDPIYTGKQFYAVFDQLKNGFFPKGSRIILTHTGGLQGIEGFEERYGLEIYPNEHRRYKK
ncbi:1-aminocyclopropane-1-carboxylate deaminase/D-cysteine desulfhydrase [Parvicella tangerina]|uniref:D-cysteine desulfhydrase n=1 Tax=Parvicella tangerina TaxID=2829795 RepID=A0A916JIP9_9FLAO|nr:pyridoxal-phosphate dependent enzyme [Parvicella tangerina]CAG5076957.1 D-cysteine desulfhydrase [Parvicella tangerina]